MVGWLVGWCLQPNSQVSAAGNQTERGGKGLLITLSLFAFLSRSLCIFYHSAFTLSACAPSIVTHSAFTPSACAPLCYSFCFHCFLFFLCAFILLIAFVSAFTFHSLTLCLLSLYFSLSLTIFTHSALTVSCLSLSLSSADVFILHSAPPIFPSPVIFPPYFFPFPP